MVISLVLSIAAKQKEFAFQNLSGDECLLVVHPDLIPHKGLLRGGELFKEASKV